MGREKEKKPDLLLGNGGAVSLFRPASNKGKQWLEDLLSSADLACDPLFFGEALAVEHRYVGDVLGEARQDGLQVEVQEGEVIYI